MMVTLSEVGILTPGYAFKSKDFGEHQAKVIKITDIKPDLSPDSLCGVNTSNYDDCKLQKYIVREGDYFIAMTGSIGKVGRLSSGQAYLNQRVLGVRATQEIDSEFLWFMLNTKEFNDHLLTHVDSHSVQANISAKSVGSFQFNLPSLANQRKLTTILAPIEKQIELNNRINDYLAA